MCVFGEWTKDKCGGNLPTFPLDHQFCHANHGSITKIGYLSRLIIYFNFGHIEPKANIEEFKARLTIF